MALYRSLGLTAKAAAMVLAEIVSMITRRQRDDEMLKTLCEKFSGIELVFASYILGRIVGMSYAIKDIFRFWKKKAKKNFRGLLKRRFWMRQLKK